MGQYEDVESRLIENRYRTLVPELGGYVSPDPMHASMLKFHTGVATYGYVGSRPLMYQDPTGLYFLDNTWNNDLIKKGQARIAMVEARTSKPCNCWFKAVFGRRPWNDFGSISLKTMAPSEFGESTPQGINIARGLWTMIPFQDQNAKLRETISHEISHQSFNTSHSNTGRPPPTSAYFVGQVCTFDDAQQARYLISNPFGGGFQSQWDKIGEKFERCMECGN